MFLFFACNIFKPLELYLQKKYFEKVSSVHIIVDGCFFFLRTEGKTNELAQIGRTDIAFRLFVGA